MGFFDRVGLNNKPDRVRTLSNPTTIKTKNETIVIKSNTKDTFTVRNEQEARVLRDLLLKEGYTAKRKGNKVHVTWDQRAVDKMNLYYTWAGLTALATYVPVLLGTVSVGTLFTPGGIALQSVMVILFIAGVVENQPHSELARRMSWVKRNPVYQWKMRNL